VEWIVEVVQALDLDVAQLHGDATPAQVEAVRARTGCVVWPVLRVEGTTLPDAADGLAGAAGWLVLDAKVVGQLGGTGVPLDWSGLADAIDALRARAPGTRLVLAGGLRPSNVKRAISLLAPEVVDVSSGVETAPGVKDPDAVVQFVRAVRESTGAA
jgi:phosphoribosylanthranilate isomerase